ncbi:MAG: DUF1294 domain-containing protein [Ruminococcaceae bacterium]|nr:DUF1294 domain-containing protein [Oscillospiraceae bacterium]
MLTKILCGYLLSLSLILFILMAVDKAKAKRRGYRIPELTLLGLAAMGGAPGMWLAMGLLRHKTLHLRFKICAPLFSVLWAALIIYLSTVSL